MQFAAHMPSPGNLALISQSGAIAAGVVDWAAQRTVSFSGIVSIGDQLDVDIADLLDYFALDGKTRAILLYVEAIKDARKFMSAARAAARIKPVVVVKSGRMAQGAKAAATPYGQKIETAGSMGSIRVRRSLAACRALLFCDDQWPPSRIGREGEHDRDTKYTQSFRTIIASGQVEPLALPSPNPNLNAYAERWVRSVKEECLSKTVQ
jgi:Succinyl-CoA ligase like flavodoxin domain